MSNKPLMSKKKIVNKESELTEIYIVCIEWLDSKLGTAGWEYIDSIEPLKPCKCVSVGYLIKDSEDYKTIVQSLSDTQFVGRITIPTCSILKMTKIRKANTNFLN